MWEMPAPTYEAENRVQRRMRCRARKRKLNTRNAQDMLEHRNANRPGVWSTVVNSWGEEKNRHRGEAGYGTGGLSSSRYWMRGRLQIESRNLVGAHRWLLLHVVVRRKVEASIVCRAIVQERVEVEFQQNIAT